MKAEAPELREAILRTRRGVGSLYLLCGLLCLAGTFAARLLARRLLSIPAGPVDLIMLFYGHFLVLIVGGLGYLGHAFHRDGLFYYEVLADFLAGVAVYVVFISIVARTLGGGRAGVWLSLLPAVFLGAYGMFLRSGRGLKTV